MQVNDSLTGAGGGRIAVSEGRIYVIYRGGGILFRRYAGGEWWPPVCLNDTVTQHYLGSHDITVGGSGYVYVSWFEDGEIYHGTYGRVSVDDGETFSERFVIVDRNEIFQGGGGKLSAVGEDLYVVFAARPDSTFGHAYYLHGRVYGVEEGGSGRVPGEGISLDYGGGGVWYTLSRGGEVDIGLYNVAGGLVGRLFHGYSPGGRHFLPLPRDLASGVYVLRLRTPYSVMKRKIIWSR